MVIKKDRILDAAAEVLSQRPDATLQSIANAAGISRTTIFHTYPTRDALLEALGVDALERIGRVMDRVPTQDFGDVAAVMLEVTSGLMPLGPRAAFLRLVPGQGNALDSHWIDAVTPLAIYIAQVRAHGQLRSDLPTRWLVASYIGLLFAAWDEIAEGELGPAQAARLIVDSWLSGVATSTVR
ncbi:MAG: TetR/AcrR family transcriptional regulator [Candidatus Nanopelagicales bacterium]|nr:TetR/AcrR family transcriptional regulator [Candidatus Nanopelagicales bacterium]MCF8539264.1 TetR/AcrR family transcriptional regulator [Candidatus Nanopelagicales bacterium]MCF8550970.1 TetR/AcrR family transcriptional regulator [Candidatus Nanopelagicales bacterium]